MCRLFDPCLAPSLIGNTGRSNEIAFFDYGSSETAERFILEEWFGGFRKRFEALA